MTQQDLSVGEVAIGRREQIINAATDYFCTHGYSGTRMSDIAEAISVTKPIVYRYFKSKEELFEAWLDAILVQETNVIITQINESKLSIKDEAMRILMGAYHGLKVKHALAPWRIALIEADSFPQISQLVCNKLKTPIFGAIRALFERGIENGEIKSNDTNELAALFCSPIAAVASIRATFGDNHHFEVNTVKLFETHHRVFFETWGK